MANNGSRASRALTISGAFIGQAGIFAGIGALVAGTASGPVGMSVSSTSVPAIAAPAPIIYSPSVLSFPYTFSMYGRASGGTVSGVYPEEQSTLPAYTVRPDQRAGIRLGVTIPDTTKITGLRVTVTGVGPNGGNSWKQPLYQDAKQALGPGHYTFVAEWPNGELQPGTQWQVYLTADSGGVSEDSTVATVTVTS
jgi:hypothetical protein